jgi:polyvinyl alcohol dehydrogenase (cytochrome)
VVATAALLVLAACTAPGPSSGGPSSAAPSSGGPSSGGPSSGGPSSGPAPTPAAAPPAGSPSVWPGYHADQARTAAVDAVSPHGVSRAWSAALGGAVRGQPVVAAGRVVAATETDRVVALDPGTGRVLWSTSIGTPLRDVDQVAGCGNIDPLGITSTPVVDVAAGTVWVVGEVTEAGVHHRLAGLDLATGAVRASADVDPPLRDGQRPEQLLQRASLALANGRVYAGFGGNLGDCGSYSGWVVGASTADPTQQVSFEVAPDGEGGAIWMGGGAPAVDAAGNLYVTTGNANPFPAGAPDPVRYAESVLALSPDLRPLAAFKDPAAGGDEDLSTGNPVLLPDGRVFAVGKTNTGYLLRAGDLTRVAAIEGVCGSDPDGGPAYDPARQRLLVPCRGGGLQVVDLAHRTLGPRLAGADSAPVLVGDTVWAVDSRRDALAAFDAATLQRRQSVDVGADVPVFTSPTVALGLVLVATTEGVTAFR